MWSTARLAALIAGGAAVPTGWYGSSVLDSGHQQWLYNRLPVCDTPEPRPRPTVKWGMLIQAQLGKAQVDGAPDDHPSHS